MLVTSLRSFLPHLLQSIYPVLTHGPPVNPSTNLTSVRLKSAVFGMYPWDCSRDVRYISVFVPGGQWLDIVALVGSENNKTEGVEETRYTLSENPPNM